MSEFKQFLLDEMKRRDMSARAFAEYIGVATSTITRAIDEREPAIPGIDFLIKLAQGTSVSITSLVAMAYPEVASTTKPSPSAQILAQQIEKLPEAQRQIVVAIIRGSRVDA